MLRLLQGAVLGISGVADVGRSGAEQPTDSEVVKRRNNRVAYLINLDLIANIPAIRTKSA